MSKSKSKKSRDDDDDAPKKRGNPGDFHGKRDEFLREHLEEYIAASEARSTRTFWPTLFAKWWALFPWTLPIEKDSTDGIELDTRPDTALSDAERAQKKKVLDTMESKVKAWYNYQRAHHGGGAKNPWAPLLKELREKTNAPAPKRLADFQCYMQRPEHKKEIQRVFGERHPNKIGGRGTINERAAIARELLAGESAEIRHKIHELADAEHEEEMKDWRATKDGTKELTEEEKEAARARWAVTIAPLLKILSDYTRYKISMIVGRIDKTTWKFDIRSLHEGKTAKGEDWPTWAADGAYNDHVVRQFMRFLLAEEGAVVLSDRVGDDPLEILRLASIAATAAVSSGPNTSAASSSSAPNTSNLANAAAAPTTASSIPAAIPFIPPAPTSAAPLRAATPTPTPALPDRPPTPIPIEFAAIIPQVRAPPTASQLDGVEGVEDVLKREVQALPADERTARIEQLKRMPVFFRQRESNIARHGEEEADAKAELEAQATKVAAEKAAAKEAKKRKAPTKRTRKGRTKRRRGPMGLDASDEEPDELVLDSDSSEDEQRGEDEQHGTPTPTPKPARPQPHRLNARGQGAAAAVNSGNADATGVQAPGWAMDAKKVLETGEMDDIWNTLVGLWWEKEKVCGFAGPTRGYTEGRPIQVSEWVRYARKALVKPAIDDVEAFGQKWWEWWILMNPNWRERSSFAPRTHPRLEQTAGGEEWGAVDYSGPNGILNVLICLRWWRDAMGPNDNEEYWVEAVEDVIWSLETINQQKASE
ncbi:hypothetical protein B0H16DRAFT_1751590 [Mycena metata]|uniref:Uncharacterized protein n=1 Tax=Mycena metata TaxID=1033252 RepID=A0AAD7DK94_9AGAR|nr:hypothetical protein B0H16DRAFT_1751590 [Mycena metata]